LNFQQAPDPHRRMPHPTQTTGEAAALSRRERQVKELARLRDVIATARPEPRGSTHPRMGQ
jgi:uncharacterized protein YjiS (DUF1127 family)